MHTVISYSKNSALAVIIALMAACTSDKPTPGTIETKTDSTVTAPTANQVDTTAYVFRYTKAGLTSPGEQIKRLATLKQVFNRALLVDPERANVFNEETRASLNLGTFLADAIYCSLNRMNAETMKARNAAQQMAAKAGLSGEPLAGLLSRMDATINNRDSVIKLCDLSLLYADSLFTAGKRKLAAANLLTGFWLECTYITSASYPDAQTPSQKEYIQAVLMEQTENLAQLAKLLSNVKRDTESDILLRELTEFQALYGKSKSAEGLPKTDIDAFSKKLAEIRMRVTM